MRQSDPNPGHMSAQQDHGWVPEDTLANRLVLVRRSLGMTQRAAAEKCGLTFGEWQSLEEGRQARGLDVKVARISRALGVNRDWLIWGGPLGGGPSGDDNGRVAAETVPGPDRITRGYSPLLHLVGRWAEPVKILPELPRVA